MTSVQRIRPQAGAGWQVQHPHPEKDDENERKPPPRQKQDHPPAKPGTGHIVDREV